ncbi:MAG: hypothetical protein NT164_05755 [Verrucomicrobiae bacterium]|nr:hypothetical protein [Verrucomicrobiae bacterium]
MRSLSALIIFLTSCIFISRGLCSENIKSLNGSAHSNFINQGRLEYAEQQVENGNRAMLQQNYFIACKNYYNALESISQENQIFTDLQKQVIHSLCEAIVLLASEENPDPAKQSEAGGLINKILNKKYPSYCSALIQLSDQFHNKQLKKPQASEKIKDYLREGEANYSREAWEDALTDYEKVHSADKNNATALLGIELINKKKNEYVTKAKTSRNEMITDMDKAWILTEAKTKTDSQKALPNNQNEDLLSRKLNTLIIPQVDFYYISITEALKQLKQQAAIVDSSEENSNKRGVNIVLKMDALRNNNPEANIHLSLRNIPLGEVINYLAQQANLKVKIEPYAVTLCPIDEDELNQPLLIQEYKVPPDFLNTFPENKKAQISIEKQETNCFYSEKEALISQGVTFPKGASAHYFSDNNILIVRNTPSNLNFLTSLIKNATEHPPVQVEIEARFVEVKENLSQEKGLNWLLGSFPIGKNVNGGGGTVGNQATYQSQNYPIQQSGTPVGTIPGGPPGAGSVTAGNRLGSSAITANTLETLLGGYFAPSAGILALAGVLTNPQFQVVLRALNQKKGVDLISSPKITVSSGKKATITIAKDFPYPDEYLPPQVPQTQGGGVNPAIPATPASFKRRNVGVELEVAPLVDSEQKTIELKLSPQIVEFQGFINYGNPIFSQAPNLTSIGEIVTGSTKQVLLTENKINQPIFSVRQVNTQVVLRPGQTVILGGLMREDVQKIKDKTPIIGDIPLAGKLFRSSSEQHIKKNLLIFVTVWLIDSSGRKIKN